MRKRLALGLLLVVSWLGGGAPDARAGVTIDVVFQDATSPSGITINAGDPGPGCAFSGYYGGSVSTGYCMDVIMTTTWEFTDVGVSVAYEGDNGLEIESMREWPGIWIAVKSVLNNVCLPDGELADNGGVIQRFGCLDVPSQTMFTTVPGTYRLGTIIWDPSATTPGTEAIQAVLASGDSVTVVINGNTVDVSASVVLESHILTIIPEPGTFALLGLGLVGLIISARRRRA